MEEKRPGQHPQADREADPAAQNRSARPGGEAGGSDRDDRACIRAADERARATKQAMRDGGFGDHKGVDGFPALDRED